MTTYPNAFDSDLELPRADNDVTELSADYINSLRDAVIAIQKALGINPQGQKTSLTNRINVSIDRNGYIKKDAIENIGLVSLPITNNHIGTTAGIKESKLDLDYNTSTLKASIDSLRTDITGLLDGISINTEKINSHSLGRGYYHDGYHIKINSGKSIGVAGLSSSTIGDAINEISTRLLSGNKQIDPHIDLDIPSSVKHAASKISINGSNFTILDRTVSNVQEAIDNIDASSGVFGEEHLDAFHSNGILKEIRSGSYYNSRDLLLGPISRVTYDEGLSIITIPGVTSLSSLNIKVGDIVKIHEREDLADYGNYQIRAIGPLTSSDSLGNFPTLSANQLAIFHTFVESRASGDDVTISIYKPGSGSSEYAPLACTVRNNETIIDSISVLPPNAARAVSLGFNGSILNRDGYQISLEVGIGDNQYRQITIPNLNRERLGTNQPEPVSAKSVAERINAYVSDPDLGNHFPISAYRVGNELIIAHNWVGQDYTLEVLDGYNANYALGLDAYGANLAGKVINGSEGNKYVINGKSKETLYTVFDGYASISAETNTFVLWTNSGQMINPLRYGISAGSVMHVSGHSTLDSNGSYTLMSANSSSVSTFNSEKIPAPTSPTTFNVKFTDANVSLNVLESTENDRGLVEIYIDSSGQTLLHQRLLYGTSLGSSIEIINVSAGFPAGSISLIVGLSGEYVTFNIYDETFYGETVEIHENFKGSFKLYHPNGIDYFFIQIVPGTISGGIEVVEVSELLPEDEAMLLCAAHFDNNLSITNLIDSRLFGNISSNQVSDEFIEVFTQHTTRDLRSNGVVRGFDVLDALYYDSISSMQALPLRGGVAYIDGSRINVETQKVNIQSYTSEGNLVTGRRVIAINDLGSIQVFSDELNEILVDGYNSSSVFGKMLPLYYIEMLNGNINDVIDVRRFINNLDDKIEVIVDETNNNIGNFKSLEGALLFADKYPDREKLTIKIVGTINLESAITVASGISIIGGSPYGGNSKHQIVNYSVIGSNLITLKGNNRIENLEIISPSVSLGESLVYIDGPNVSIENCLLRFGEEVSTNTVKGIELSRNATKDIRIVNNKIDNVFDGIVGEYGTEDLLILNNKLTNVSGTDGNSYGIMLGTGSRAVDNVIISENYISVPSVVTGTDLRGIEFKTGFDADILKISNNSIIHEAQNTMTNGIRVSVVDGYAGVVDQLLISNNIVDGIKLDDNYVFGIYVSNANKAIIRENVVKNIGVSAQQRVNTAAIRLASTFGLGEIVGNIIKDCSVLRGIEIESQLQTSRVNISRNTLMNLGSSAHYVRGSTSNSAISDNILIGPGEIGIRWSGSNSKISNNNLNRPNTLPVDDYSSDYAFEQYAIYVPTSDIDIVNNTITGMIFDQESIGISNGGSSRNRLKILGNTISGSMMYKMLELYGSDHVINNNKFSNESLPDAQATLCIQLNSVTNALIMGNSFRGIISNAIASSSTAASNLTITNNSVVAETIMTSSIKLDGTTEDCLIIGNRFPDGSTEDNVIGSTPSYGSYNTNTIGINFGLQDTRSIHASSGVSAFETIPSDGYAGVSHWTFKGTNDYWEANRAASNDPRVLYLPINGLPNGSKIQSVQIQGRMPSSAKGTLTGQVYKRSVKASGLTITAISSSKDMSTATENFGNSLDIGSISITTTGGEIINYAESTYYIQITHQGQDVNASDIRIYGATINFIY